MPRAGSPRKAQGIPIHTTLLSVGRIAGPVLPALPGGADLQVKKLSRIEHFLRGSPSWRWCVPEEF